MWQIDIVEEIISKQKDNLSNETWRDPEDIVIMSCLKSQRKGENKAEAIFQQIFKYLNRQWLSIF